jgi:hypothetical protein
MSDRFRLWCLVQGDERNRVFSIHVQPNDTVSDLKKAILAKKPFEHIKANDLKLWKVSEWCRYAKLVHRSDFP